jgi:ribonuclease PH
VPATVFAPAVAAVSVGIVADEPLLDLCYEEDSRAQVDSNIVMNARGEFIEVQSSAERGTFGSGQLAALLRLGERGIADLLTAQSQVI